MFFRRLDRHQAHLEELGDQLLAELAALVHFAHVGRDALAGETADSVVEKAFVVV